MGRGWCVGWGQVGWICGVDVGGGVDVWRELWGGVRILTRTGTERGSIWGGCEGGLELLYESGWDETGVEVRLVFGVRRVSGVGRYER